MKKIVVLALAVLSFGNTQAQNENNLKNFRFGLKAAPSINWYKPDNTKKYSNAGALMKFNWGLMMEFRLNDVASLTTGLEVMYDGGKQEFIDTTWYAYSKTDQNIATPPSDTSKWNNYTGYKLNERKYNVTYLNIPLNIKMKTKDIGGLTYFGQFGATLGIKLKAKATDEVQQDGVGASTSLTDVDISKDMQFMRMGANIGGGVEWNLSGSTSLVFGLNYNLGFTNVLSKTSDYLFHSATVNGSTPTYNFISQKTASHNISLVIGVLF